MDSDRSLEPATSVASTASDSEQRPPRRQSTFEEDDSDSSEDVRHDQMADLQRMMSRRTFAVADGANGLRHQRGSSTTTGSAGAEATDSDGQLRRRASTVEAPEPKEASPEDQPQASKDQVMRAVTRGSTYI